MERNSVEYKWRKNKIFSRQADGTIVLVRHKVVLYEYGARAARKSEEKELEYSVCKKDIEKIIQLLREITKENAKKEIMKNRRNQVGKLTLIESQKVVW